MTHNFEQQTLYARHLARDRRLVILRVLADSAREGSGACAQGQRHLAR